MRGGSTLANPQKTRRASGAGACVGCGARGPDEGCGAVVDARGIASGEEAPFGNAAARVRRSRRGARAPSGRSTPAALASPAKRRRRPPPGVALGISPRGHFLPACGRAQRPDRSAPARRRPQVLDLRRGRAFLRPERSAPRLRAWNRRAALRKARARAARRGLAAHGALRAQGAGSRRAAGDPARRRQVGGRSGPLLITAGRALRRAGRAGSARPCRRDARLPRSSSTGHAGRSRRAACPAPAADRRRASVRGFPRAR